MLQLDWSETARSDLRAIGGYLALHDAAAAGAHLRAVYRSAELLRDYPMAGPKRDERTRSLRVRGTAYVLVYAVQGDRVTILHVYHIRQDWRP